MSLPLPHSVRIKTARTDRHITRDLRDLTYRETAIGGFASATMSLHRPLRLQPDELLYYARVYVYDQTGTVVWEGRLEDPELDSGGDGEVWRLTCMGPSAYASDRTVPLIYVEDSLDRWNVTRDTANDLSGGTMTVAAEVGGDMSNGLWLRLPTGTAVGVDDRVSATYYGFAATGQNLALFDAKGDCGISDASWRVQARTEDATVVRNVASSTGGFASSPQTFPNFSLGQQAVYWMLVRITSSTTTSTSDVTWIFLDDVRVRATTYSKAGVEKTSSYTVNDLAITADVVVADLLGRGLLDQYDGANAYIDDTAAYEIRELAWPGGVTPKQVLDALMDFEPAYRWGAYESNAAGLHRFEWKPWPSTVRYVATTVDGFTSPASAADLYNAVNVFYTDSRSRLQSVRVTSDVPELDDAGLTREAAITLPGTGGGATDATQAGTEWLDEHGTPTSAGTLRVSRPVLDLVDGRMVQPWQIRAGELIRVRDVQPRAAALTATGRDGISTFKIASREYRASDATATLELDEYSRSTAQALAAVARSGRNRR